ncbi:MAG: hypothetical protein K2Y39_01545 [Candidatus Obscuribacterales bacterium]|nr:hypothetical protein [Candidatus Obscuribacterales bacterium]
MQTALIIVLITMLLCISATAVQAEVLEVNPSTGLRISLPGTNERSSNFEMHACGYKFVNRLDGSKIPNIVVIRIGCRFDEFKVTKFRPKEKGKILGQKIVWYQEPDVEFGRKALLHLPKRPDILININLECADAANLSNIEKSIETLVIANPNAQEFQPKARASMFFMRGDSQRQISELNKHLVKYPDDDEALGTRAWAYQGSRRYKESLADYTQLIEKHHKRCFRERAEVYFELREFQKCIDDCERAISNYANDWQAYGLSGRAHLALKQNELAISALSKAIEYDSNHPGPWFLLRAKIYRKESKYQLALKDLTKIIESDFDTELARKERIQIYELLGEHDLAADEREELRITKANSLSFWSNGGRRHITNRPSRRALKTTDSVQTDRTQVEYYHLARMYGGAQPKQCLQCIEYAVTMNPKRPVAAKASKLRQFLLPKQVPPDEAIALNLKAYRELRNKEQCRKDITECISKFPNHEYAYITLARLEHDQNNDAAALAAYQKTLEINPNNLTALESYGDLLRGNNKEEAKKVLQRVIELDPENSSYRFSLKLCN